ncbi:MAG: FAD-binding oxidoreductase [Steroidobacteraceae bacterium]
MKQKDTHDRQQLLRREFLKGASWLTGAVLIGQNGLISEVLGADAAGAIKSQNISGLSGTPIWRGDSAYEVARQNAMWVGNKPNRFPSVIVFPKDEKDVAAAIKFAARNRIKVGARSGGHSWAAPHVQNGSMLIDLSAWNTAVVDAKNKTAWVQPAVRSQDFANALKPHQLAFPTGHNPDVALGGFLLCGGFGRNSRQWGIGCQNILEVECVNAKGELIRATDKRNADYFWAACGGGAAVPAVVTRLKVRVYDLPKVIHQRVYVYDMQDFETVVRWAIEVMPQLPDYVEPMVYRRRYDEATGGWADDTIQIIAVSFGDSVEKVEAGLAPLDTCPALSRVKSKSFKDITLDQAFERSNGVDPKGIRFAVDGMWSDADAAQLAAALKPMYETVPTPRTYIYFAMWGPVKPAADLAMSMQARVYVAAHTRWDKPEDDARMYAWATEHMRRLEPLSIGSKLNDDSMVRRKSRYFSQAAEQRLAAIRKRYDPDGVFQGFLELGAPV